VSPHRLCDHNRRVEVKQLDDGIGSTFFIRCAGGG
jgi:hypothetical protein